MVLVVMGIMFAMLFLFGKEDTGLSEEFKNADIPQSTLDALLKTSSFSCSGRTIQQALSDCKTSSQIINCGTPPTPICTAVRNDAEIILEKTLGNWSYPYKISFDDIIPDIQSEDFSCLEYRTGSQQLPIMGQSFDVFLRVCN